MKCAHCDTKIRSDESAVIARGGRWFWRWATARHRYCPFSSVAWAAEVEARRRARARFWAALYLAVTMALVLILVTMDAVASR